MRKRTSELALVFLGDLLQLSQLLGSHGSDRLALGSMALQLFPLLLPVVVGEWALRDWAIEREREKERQAASERRLLELQQILGHVASRQLHHVGHCAEEGLVRLCEEGDRTTLLARSSCPSC